MKPSIKTFSLILLLILSLVLIHRTKVVNTPFENRNFEALNIPIHQVVGKDIGVNYYSELARSFLMGKTYLLGPYNEELSKYQNPYGSEAYNAKVIIQDASFYKEKYYLYFGPLPVTLYVLIKVVFNFFPSDHLVSFLILSFSLLIYLYYANRILSSEDGLFGDLLSQKIANVFFIFSIVYFNPITNILLSWSSVHTISRFMGLQIVFFSYLHFYIIKNKENNFREIFILNLFCSLSILVKANFVFYEIFLILFSIYILKNKDDLNLKKLFLICLPLGVILTISGIYNYVRFDNPLEFGITYITNSLDYFHFRDVFAFKPKIAYLLSVYFERTYEYFFSWPIFDTTTNRFALNHKSLISISNRFYNEGFFGIFFSIPFSLIFIIIIVLDIFKNKTHEKNELLLKIGSLMLFFIQASLIYFIIMSTVGYSYEILIPIAIIFMIYNKIILKSLETAFQKLSLFSFIFSSLAIFSF
jgi:hypothetical protein